jgi:two-component sensor histidine kinase
MGMIVNELVANAVQHAFVERNGGTIRVAVRPLAGGGAEVVVADDGVGTDPALYPAGQGGSTGMPLVAALARQAKATVTLDGREGTRFVFSLPELGAVSHAPAARGRRRVGR